MNTIIREAKEEDIKRMSELFTDTLYRVNSKDYSPVQIKAWNDKADKTRWRYLFESDLTFLIAENQEEELLGFTSVDPKGYLHSMFIHADYQGKGVAGKLLSEVERRMTLQQQTSITSEVSLTACPFFLKKGFIIVKEQEIELNGVTLKNFLMEKYI